MPPRDVAPRPVAEAQAVAPSIPAELPLEAPVVAERRPRGRPRKIVAPVEVEGVPERIEMDRLPPALSPATAVDASGEDKPRRRTRRPRDEAAPADA